MCYTFNSTKVPHQIFGVCMPSLLSFVAVGNLYTLSLEVQGRKTFIRSADLIKLATEKHCGKSLTIIAKVAEVCMSAPVTY